MVAKTIICEKCGNEISKWDNGVCPRCISNGHYENLGEKWPESFTQAPIKTINLNRKIDIQKIIGIDWRLWLDAFNRLLNDIYGRDTRFSHILKNEGITDEQIYRWKHDVAWLVRFFNSLEKKVSIILGGKFTTKEYKIIKSLYGFESSLPQSIIQIISEQQISENEVLSTKKRVLSYLRSLKGKTEFEAAIYQSVLSASDLGQIYKNENTFQSEEIEEINEFENDNEYDEYINLFEPDDEEDPY